MTTRTVRRDELTTLAQKHHGDAIVLQTTEPFRARLDPTSKIRFRNGAGKFTRWIEGRELYADSDAAYVSEDVFVLDHATKIEIRGLDEAARGALSISRPAKDTELRFAADGTAEVIARGIVLEHWVSSFFDVMKTVVKPERDCMNAQRPIECLNDPAYYHLRVELGGRPLGAWTFHFADHRPVEFAGELLYTRLDGAMAGRLGWRWKDITGAEIKSLSGTLTLGAIGGTAALTALVLPVVLVGAIAAGRTGSAGSSGLTGGRNLVQGLGRAGGGEATTPEDWRPTLADTPAFAAPAFFRSAARRRAIVQLAATAEASIDPFGADHLVDGGAAVLRFDQIFELGAGGLHLASHDERGFVHNGIAFARLGFHLPLDAAHKVAVPLSIDLGGGGGESFGLFTRLNWGVRIALNDYAFVGISPASPTYINWKHQSSRQKSGVMSGLELGLVW